MLNKTSETQTVTVSAATPTAQNIDFAVIDIEIYAVDASVGINSQSEILTGLQLAPNPATEMTFIDLTLEKAANISVKVTDITGKVMHLSNYRLGAGSTQLDLSVNNWASGMYLVQIADEKQQFSRYIKMIVR